MFVVPLYALVCVRMRFMPHDIALKETYVIFMVCKNVNKSERAECRGKAVKRLKKRGRDQSNRRKEQKER